MSTNQVNKVNPEEKIVYDKKEFNKIQEELVEKTNGKFFKSIKPSNAIFKRKSLTKNLRLTSALITPG